MVEARRSASAITSGRSPTTSRCHATLRRRISSSIEIGETRMQTGGSKQAANVAKTGFTRRHDKTDIWIIARNVRRLRTKPAARSPASEISSRPSISQEHLRLRSARWITQARKAPVSSPRMSAQQEHPPTRRKAPGFYPAIHGNARKAATMTDPASGRLSAYAGQGQHKQWRGA